MKNNLKIAFIGGGNMAVALINGLLPGLASPEQIHVVDVNQAALTRLESEFAVRTSLSIDAQLEAVDVIILAVKPQQMRDAVAALANHLNGQLLISIAAGIRASDISRWLSNYDKIVRVMPNTPALISKGITGLFALPGVTEPQKDLADAILRAVGATSWVAKERLIDVVTAVSGSGPAYVFYFIEALQQAAAELGLTAEQATQFAIATFEGAAQLAMHSSDSVKVLRERVTSKGGTTYAALTTLDELNVKPAIITAIKAAASRATELGAEFGQQD
ncbi:MULTISPECIES: pyrroline-5-carboxylate reductase [unclassified Undibacterium]|uniref:pyrroline-5-carboxylate reductase n=1 Tax=unclassified Undibacterium TaxID=2630295 RepID=UPI002AC8BF27|nr:MULTISPECIES: pyrroline-5-carboxylate reductase [unclassified Undibacterium]MEB0137952.1 pyrroline-5-carboxylate reductase [Undibacterium sp. CCC2.1]MEB0173102.1 pyrroline-5-carboxylate reductase [Undibacterium sp. CCC1.1]MEB0174960.1 pyrroline-5-carboxylate reductase [Undibacterium sp. CCC3.4]MEB0216132.1 pyrroline-5-carboxylate reductase [Undibacterium sp. 5I2]WPX45403.1 pyrroline-5-carboxylate reductase [Undibacterium sp. CCC3.4]